ncbi:hypothetical protein [Streptococcus macacae]|uniref:O-antigen ligase n=1 Tax=Streptococcus macacae NCTC 11558 TaxID=764298 RepID=G5JVU9_9STRE|nr:hypothetical protein [Streptococcus macacae]EHJ52380.1 hypothetical protein STRMA_1117 [Streptococcus macacae NCTC 11558]SUN78940.1 oligosaccharide repeat unit polymerase [Streptococcus macacae NCTC 11558]
MIDRHSRKHSINRLIESWPFLGNKPVNYYRYFYTLAVIVAIYTYFFKRYIPGDSYQLYTIFSLCLSLLAFIWHTYLTKLTLKKAYAIFASLVFIILMPSSFYLLDHSSDFSILSFFLLSVSIDPKQTDLIRFLFYAKFFLAIGVLFFYVRGQLPDVTSYRASLHLVRHSYGFMHPNSLSMFAASLLYDFSLMKEKSTNLLETLSMILFSLLIYSITDSRTGLMAFILVIFCSVFKTQLLKVELSGDVLFVDIIIIFIVGTALSYFYKAGSPLSSVLNKAFTGRLSNAHRYLLKYSFSLTPRKIPDLHYADGSRIFNENFYVDSLMRQGLFVYLLFPIMIGFQLMKKNITLYHFILILATFMTAMMEDYGVSFCISSIMLFDYFSISRKPRSIGARI